MNTSVKKNKKEKGQGLVEYALILVLVSIVVIGALNYLAPIIGIVFSTVGGTLASAGGGGGAAAAVPTDPAPTDCDSANAAHDAFHNDPANDLLSSEEWYAAHDLLINAIANCSG